VPSGTLSDGLREIACYTLRENFTNLVPTTYEVAKAYLDQELLKPEGQRDLLREMCMLIVLKIPNDQDLALIAEATKMLIEIKEGTIPICVLRARTLQQPILIQQLTHRYGVILPDYRTPTFLVWRPR
jgi:hypothetical protein